MAKKKTETKEPAPVKEKVKKKKTEVQSPKRIRMLKSLANTNGAYTKGHAYEVGKDLSVETAKSWLRSKAAEEDKAIDGAPENK